MDRTGIGEFILNRVCGRRLEEFAESSAGVGISPAWRFHFEFVEQLKQSIAIHWGHPFIRRRDLTRFTALRQPKDFGKPAAE
jgi:hypothetical protein